MAADPAQARNVIAERPEIVARLREHYARWWSEVEPRVNEFAPVHIGSAQEPVTLLSPCEWRDVFLDQQAQVRTQKRNGVWTLFAEQDGEYEFSLRRWPSEADAAITAAMPAHQGTDGMSRAGVAWPVARAEIKVGGISESRAVGDGDKAANFAVRLKRGPTTLQTWFRDTEGKEIAGAYYVYVRRL